MALYKADFMSGGGSGGSAIACPLGKVVADGSVNESTLPYNFVYSSAVVLNDEIHILGGANSKTSHHLVKPDNRHIATMLPKGVHILLSDNEDIIYASNAKRISSNIAEVTDTGYVELFAALTDADNIKGYLTFY